MIVKLSAEVNKFVDKFYEAKDLAFTLYKYLIETGDISGKAIELIKRCEEYDSRWREERGGDNRY